MSIGVGGGSSNTKRVVEGTSVVDETVGAPDSTVSSGTPVDDEATGRTKVPVTATSATDVGTTGEDPRSGSTTVHEPSGKTPPSAQAPISATTTTTLTNFIQRGSQTPSSRKAVAKA
jgi:hypothetical protein